jgi:glycosyltransferase involved in cell wall biosynthesis
MRRVIHVITTASRGGAENHLLHLSTQQVKNGRSVTVIFLKGDGNLSNRFEISGVHLIKEIANKNPFFQIIWLRKTLRKYPEAIVHSHLPRAELVAACASGRMLRIFSRHNTEPFYPGAPKPLSSLLGTIASFRVKRCIAISNAVKEAITTNAEIWEKTKVEVVRYGLPENLEERSVGLPESVQAKILSLRDENMSILTCVARLTPQKDFPTLLHGFKLALEKNSKLHLLVAGEGDQRIELVQITQTLGISSHVTWLGNIENPRDLMRQSDLFVLASRYEGFGLVLLEAMQAGCPIIAAKNSAIPEVLGEDYQGLFLTGDSHQLAQRIIEFLNFEYIEKVRSYLSKRLLEFSVQEMESNTTRVYEGIELR